MLNDLRYALRALRQNPGFALTAIISIALAIGANSAVFSMADALLLRPLSVPDASRVFSVRAQTPSGRLGNVSYADYADFRDRNKSFDGLVGYSLAPAGVAKDKETQPQLRIGFLVTGNFFSVLGVQPQIGRGFLPEEDMVPGRDPVMVLSYDLWKSEFAAAPSAIGRKVWLNGHEFTVIGVAPESFTGVDHLLRPSFYAPTAMAPTWSATNADFLTDRSKRELLVKGRLKSGVSMNAASADIGSIAKSIEESYPSTNRSYGATVRTERQARIEFDPSEEPLLSMLFMLVAVVLAIACANVANLMLSRGQSRAREVAVRLAIGANRYQLVRQLMAESLVIAVAGAGLGLLIAQYVVEMFSTLEIPGDLPIQFAFKLDLRVLAFTFLVSIASAVLFGLAPALQSTKRDLVSGLKMGESDQARKRMFGRRALVVVQIAGSLVLLIAATQAYSSLQGALLGAHGFQVDHRLTMRFAPASAGYTPEQTAQFYKTLIERTRNMPGVKLAALSASLPMTTNFASENVSPEGYQFPAGQEAKRILADYVGDSYFETFAIPLLDGRGFTSADRENSPPVAVVNEEFAKNYFHGDALGKRIKVDRNGEWIEIVGVTVTGQHMSAFEPPMEWIYLPSAQHPQSRMTLIAESYGNPAALAAPLRNVVHSIDPNVPIFAVRTMEDLFDQRSVKVGHLFMGGIGALGGMGLLLALVGLYAVVAYQVGRRTREIGIRVALGAARIQVMNLVLKHAATMAVTGILAGTILSIAGHQMLETGPTPQVISIFTMRPGLLALLAFSLLGITLLAAAIPARRAARIDPMKALRQE